MAAAIHLEDNGPPYSRVADTHHVSLLAVHHLRNTGSSAILDQITGSIGMTGEWVARSS